MRKTPFERRKAGISHATHKKHTFYIHTLDDSRASCVAAVCADLYSFAATAGGASGSSKSSLPHDVKEEIDRLHAEMDALQKALEEAYVVDSCYLSCARACVRVVCVYNRFFGFFLCVAHTVRPSAPTLVIRTRSSRRNWMIHVANSRRLK